MPDEFDNLTNTIDLLETAEERDDSINDGEAINDEGTIITLDK